MVYSKPEGMLNNLNHRSKHLLQHIAPYCQNMLLTLLVCLSVFKLTRGNDEATELIERTFIELDDERDNLLNFNYTFLNTKLKAKYDTLPHKHEHTHNDELKQRRRKRGTHQDNTRKHELEDLKSCKVKFTMRTLRFVYSENITLCLFKDHWEEDVVQNMLVKIQGEDDEEMRDYTFMKKVGPVTGFVLNQPGSLVTGYIIHSHFYGQVRLHDWQLNHFIVYYIEPLNMLPWYNRSMTLDEAVDRANAFDPTANAILFEYLINPTRRKVKVKRKQVEPESKRRKPRKKEVVLSTTLPDRIRTTRQPKQHRKHTNAPPKPTAGATKPPATSPPPPPVVHSTKLPSSSSNRGKQKQIIHSTTKPPSQVTKKAVVHLSTKASAEPKTTVASIVHSTTKVASKLDDRKIVHSTVKPIDLKERRLPIRLTTVASKPRTSSPTIVHLTTQSSSKPDVPHKIIHSSTIKIPVEKTAKSIVRHSTTIMPSLKKTPKVVHPSTQQPKSMKPSKEILHLSTQKPNETQSKPIVHLTTSPPISTSRRPYIKSTAASLRQISKSRSTPAVKTYKYIKSTPEPRRKFSFFISTPVPKRVYPYYISTPVAVNPIRVLLSSTESTAAKYSHAKKESAQDEGKADDKEKSDRDERESDRDERRSNGEADKADEDAEKSDRDEEKNESDTEQTAEEKRAFEVNYSKKQNDVTRTLQRNRKTDIIQPANRLKYPSDVDEEILDDMKSEEIIKNYDGISQTSQNRLNRERNKIDRDREHMDENQSNTEFDWDLLQNEKGVTRDEIDNKKYIGESTTEDASDEGGDERPHEKPKIREKDAEFRRRDEVKFAEEVEKILLQREETEDYSESNKRDGTSIVDEDKQTSDQQLPDKKKGSKYEDKTETTKIGTDETNDFALEKDEERLSAEFPESRQEDKSIGMHKRTNGEDEQKFYDNMRNPERSDESSLRSKVNFIREDSTDETVENVDDGERASGLWEGVSDSVDSINDVDISLSAGKTAIGSPGRVAGDLKKYTYEPKKSVGDSQSYEGDGERSADGSEISADEEEKSLFEERFIGDAKVSGDGERFAHVGEKSVDDDEISAGGRENSAGDRKRSALYGTRSARHSKRSVHEEESSNVEMEEIIEDKNRVWDELMSDNDKKNFDGIKLAERDALFSANEKLDTHKKQFRLNKLYNSHAMSRQVLPLSARSFPKHLIESRIERNNHEGIRHPSTIMEFSDQLLRPHLITTIKPRERHRRDVDTEESNKPAANASEITDLLDDDDDIIEEVLYPKGTKSEGVEVFDIMKKHSYICKLCLWIDEEFANLFGFQAGYYYAAAELIDLVRYMNWVTRPMDFNTDYVPENFGFAVKRVLISSIPDIDDITPEEWQNDARKLAPQISKILTSMFGEDTCCAILAFVFKDMPPFGTVAYRRALCVKHKNFAIITGGIQTMKVAKFDIYRFASHALGHLMGAMNDDVGDTDCYDGNPSSYKNLFIMHPVHQLNIGSRPNSMRMSFCSRVKISVFLDSAYTNCFEKSSRAFCGNGIVEEGEECDCGAPWQCLFMEECCGLKDSFHACEMVKGLQYTKCNMPQIMEVDTDPDDLQ